MARDTSRPSMKPPGLSTTHDGAKACQSCQFFDGRDDCLRYNYPVRSFNVCAAFKLASPEWMALSETERERAYDQQHQLEHAKRVVAIHEGGE